MDEINLCQILSLYDRDITRAEKGGFMNGVLTAVHERDRS